MSSSRMRVNIRISARHIQPREIGPGPSYSRPSRPWSRAKSGSEVPPAERMYAYVCIFGIQIMFCRSEMTASSSSQHQRRVHAAATNCTRAFEKTAQKMYATSFDRRHRRLRDGFVAQFLVLRPGQVNRGSRQSVVSFRPSNQRARARGLKENPTQCNASHRRVATPKALSRSAAIEYCNFLSSLARARWFGEQCADAVTTTLLHRIPVQTDTIKHLFAV